MERIAEKALRAASRCVHLLAVTILLLAGAGVARAQISPGPLSRAHQSVSGPTQCGSCHRFGAGKADFKCLDCHTEIATRLAEQRGLHPALIGNRVANQSCASCHSEHNGENFNLIRWDPAPRSFDHSKTGYALEGKHAGLECKSCHAPAHIAEVERRKIVMKDASRTFLGLSRDCLSCHKDEHRGQLGPNCQQCHTFADWKTVSQFDHARTRFPLTGRHAQVDCQKCHPVASGPEKSVQYKGLAFAQCTDCHKDPHRGSFANSCQSCHTTSGWKQVALSGKFDHAKTVFPLLGKHAGVQCSECHFAGDFKRPVAHQRCMDCHKPDPHNGQFRQRADGGECASCHTVEGFKPAVFGVKEHAATAYPLEGRHAAVDCAKCHVPAGKATVYKVKYALCTDCHADAHKGQFAGSPHSNRCETCHTLAGYRPSTFTLQRHQATRFPLGGGHVAVACIECHRVDSSVHPAPPVPYRFEDRSCAGCHADPHRGQFRERMAKARADGTPAGCEACHVDKSWRDVARFDHATTSFLLTGTHRAVACASCHRAPNLEVTLRNVSFRSAPKDCQGCHEDVHGGQFSPQGKPPACADCHNTAKWKPSLFDHDKRTTFALQGGHKDVPCASCHKLTRQVGGKNVLFYKPTPKDCAACHGAA